MSTWIEGAALYAVGGDIVGMGATVEARFRPLDGADGNQLIEAGVFTSKYDVRSTWILTEQV